jgi:hypothetical protein
MPKALCCYGLICIDRQPLLLWFVDWHPISQVTTNVLAWVCRHLAAGRKRVLVLIWDNDSLGFSPEVRIWIRQHNP